MPVAEDFKDDPPVPFDCKLHTSILSRCNVHPEYNGCYQCHLEKDHRPKVEE